MDESTLKDKKMVLLYQARIDGKTIQFIDAVSVWHDLQPQERIEFVHRVRPQTVKEVAQKLADGRVFETNSQNRSYVQGFVDGSKWQENQSK